MSRPRLGIGLIGTGFMGLSHALAWAAAARTFDLPAAIDLVAVADINEAHAASCAARWGFSRASGDWQSLIADPAISVISITAPNALHHPMAMAAIAAGKHVHCEKPLAPSTAQAREMTEAARAAGVKTQVGFNYLCNPLFSFAKAMIEGGELGQIISFRGIHAEDYMADPAAPYSFRHAPEGGGVAGDLGSHIFATAEYLCGPISRLLGDQLTVTPERTTPQGERKAVEVDDISRAFLRFESGASGSLEASWVATGRKMQHDWEIYGTKGALAFSQERFSELRYFNAGDPAGRQGFRRIEAGPDHAPYKEFCVAPGHQLGFNDLKTIEMARFAAAIAGDLPEPFGFAAGMRVQALLESLSHSAKSGTWADIPAKV